MKKISFMFVSYFCVVFGLFLYSFTQIDLSLTFSRMVLLQDLTKAFQQIGYFDRPLSSALYVIIIIALYCFYIAFLYLAKKSKITKRGTWILLLSTTAILAFSYNAFSYDLFNYIFDAKIITQYQQNPYEHKALDYPGDPMLSFMRWTHRVYPYGPAWLGITTPLSFIGFHYFLPTFFLFKALMAASFIGSLYFIGKILQKISPQKEIMGLLFFGLNPLLLIESLVSAHLDIVMVFFCLWSFYLLIHEKYVASFVSLIVSIGIKFATGFLLPMYVWVFILQRKKRKIPWERVLFSAACLMILTVIIASFRTTFQPWYLVLPLSFAALLSYRYYVVLPSVIVSFAALLTYVPFLYTGNWNPPIPQILATIYASSYILAAVSIVAVTLFKKK